ncbi:preprotein translocase subunit TatA [Candidatus Collierbacteria bacterium RIFOXYD1_FULL_40_9]|uniref:Preprotein translocase subunit TatA n=1 Tax=Candidatus Collierbacteria bacterium RIFOXYD1_FULL_40_9 TaxID=1817731 RepID=A0A1F5FX32_9BACT|nr:MAG: preprotein translocase subunit TatA [Candidatus Collierbacteria bacterium RIFOXYD1_FULL_40_9]
MPTIGTTEIIVIAVIILALFGAKKIPELIRGMSSGIKEYKQASKDNKDAN